MTKNIFEQLGLPRNPVMLAPLAGVSDSPFRRVCTDRGGADLCYVEMLSAAAIVHTNKRTLDMMRRHPAEGILGVQLTGRNPDELSRAVAFLNTQNFETIDINMGCPVKKVVATGCGSALLRDPEKVFRMVQAAKNATDKPLSVKIRLGWDHHSYTYLAVGEAAEKAGAAWVTMHGRTRSDDYSMSVDLEALLLLKRRLGIPVVGNGNLFTAENAEHMRRVTEVDGIMVSRGALGNPWVFRGLKDPTAESVHRDEWHEGFRDHLLHQMSEYGDTLRALLPLRKHLLWYLKGWPNVKAMRERIVTYVSLSDVIAAVSEFRDELYANNIERRTVGENRELKKLFKWSENFDKPSSHEVPNVGRSIASI